jgi:hypothetical protein
LAEKLRWSTTTVRDPRSWRNIAIALIDGSVSAVA